MKIKEVLEWIKNPENKEKLFGVRYVKRSDPLDASGKEPIYEMFCTYGNKRELAKVPRKAPVDFKFHNLLVVWCEEKHGYRSIGIEGLREIKLDCEWEKVEHE